MKVVQCHGVFDVFHYGHLIMLQFARTSALLFGAQMQRVLRTKRALACILLALVPVGVAVLVAVIAHEESEAPPGMSIVRSDSARTRGYSLDNPCAEITAAMAP